MRTRAIVTLSTAILFHLYWLFKNYLARQKYRKLANKLSNLSLTSPKQILHRLTQNQGGWLEALCQGRIHAGEPCYSALTPDLRVAYSRIFKGDLDRFGRRTLLRVQEPSFMQLRGKEGNVKLFESHNATVMPTRIQQVKMRPFFFDRLKSLFRRVTGPSISLDQFHKCDEVFQCLLAEGSECVVLGKFGLEGGEAACVRPRLMFPDRRGMVNFVKQSMDRLRRVNLLLGISLGVFALILLKQLYVLFKRYRGQSNGAFDHVKNIFVKSRVCSQCHQNLSCVYNSKCKHMVVCQDCFVRPGTACLECQEKEIDYVEMFVC